MSCFRKDERETEQFRTGRRVSHVLVMDVPVMRRRSITDAVVNIALDPASSEITERYR